jgi:hypothetical protein
MCLPDFTVHLIVGLPVDFIKLQESISGFRRKVEKICALPGYYAG